MSIELMGAAWHVRLDPSAKAVLISLADQAHEDNDGECWPAVGTIVERTCLSERTVQAALKRLEAAGWLTTDIQGSRRRTNRYRLNVVRLFAERDAAKARKAQERAMQRAPSAAAAPARSLQSGASETPQQLHPAAAAPRSSCTIDPAAAAPEPKRELNTNTPIPPAEQGAEVLPEGSGSPKSKPRSVVRPGVMKLADWLQLCREEGVKPIPADDPVFDYAESVGISREMVAMAWAEFKRKRLKAGKGQKDWRATFRDAVRGNWFRLWVLRAGDEPAILSTVGEQLRRELATAKEPA